MPLNIESPHGHLNQKLKGLINDQFEHLQHIYSRIENMDVVLRKVKDAQLKNSEVEVKLMMPGRTLFALERQEHYEEALHKVIADMEHQLHKHKEKQNEVR